MKKILLWITALFLFLLVPVTVSAEEINDFSSATTVNPNGTIHVVESITYDFGSNARHGIFRDINLIKENQEGKKFILDVDVNGVTDETGKSYQYEETNQSQSIQIKIGDPDRTITGIHEYKIDYTVSGALTYFSDHDELYWNVTGNSWNVPITHAIATITLPGEVSADNQITCFTGPMGATAHDCLVEKKGNIVKIETPNTLNISEGLTVAVGFPKGIVAVLEPAEYQTFFETFLGKITIIGIIIGVALWYFVYPLWIIAKWYTRGRDPYVGGPVAAWYDPPKTSGGRKLLPGEAGTLIDEVVNIRDISATIVDLSRRGYMKIDERKKNDFYLSKQTPKNIKDALSSYEVLLYEALFSPSNFKMTFDNMTSLLTSTINASFSLGNKNQLEKLTEITNEEMNAPEKQEVRLKNLQLADSVKNIQAILYKTVVAEKFFDKDPSATRMFYNIIGGMAVFTLNIPLALIAFVVGRNMPKKTLLGAQQAMVARSLKNFLKGQERQLTFQAKNQMWFERLLPYAVAFGVEKYWAEQFKDISMKKPEWYSTYDNRPFNSLYLTNHLASSFSSIASAATPTSSSSGFSSGFSGGSSGGGGGGGGGGSW